MVEAIHRNDFICVESGTPSSVVHFSGAWIIDNASTIDADMSKTLLKAGSQVVIDCSRLDQLDTTGAVLIRRFASRFEDKGAALLTGVKAEHKHLLDVVAAKPAPVETEPETLPWYLIPVAEAGHGFMNATASITRLISFIGLVLIRLFGTLLAPGRIRFIPLVHQMDAVGVKAMGIVGLISFLIGAVMVNQGSIQLAKFGADVFVIDMLGIIHLREMGVLLTSIIIAGRSGSAFTAQIGSMKLHEEVDAMKTLGMNPIDVLVLPRLMALMITLPLLTFYADMMGIVGGIAMAWGQLDISPGNFLVYFRDVIEFEHFIVGIIKAPFFAAVISACGCYQGLRVASSADVLGARTTKSVVTSIFLVIVLDALFAIFFTSVGI